MNKVEAKPKTGHEERMPWAGWFPHPTYDQDVFGRLPAWRKAEMLELQEFVKNNPHAQSCLIYNPATMQPYPGQVLLCIEKKVEKQVATIPQLKYTIPNGVPRGVFFYHYPEPTEEEAKIALAILEKLVTKEKVVEVCTKNRELSNEKPMNGAYAFIWRVARYCTGLDPLIPLTTFLDLMDGVNYFTGLKINPQSPLLMKFFDIRIQELVSTTGGAKKYY